MAAITSPTIIITKNAVDSVVVPVTRTFKFAGGLTVTNTGPNEATVENTGFINAWSVVGNAGGGLVLGTTTNDAFNVIQNNKISFGLKNGRVEFLKSHDNFAGSENQQLTFGLTTLDGVPTEFFRLTTSNNSLGQIKLKIIGKRDSMDSGCVLERSISFKNVAGVASYVGRLNTPFTSRFGTSYNVEFSTTGADIVLKAIGFFGHEVYWTGLIEHQSIINNT